jgi:processive 1,2-diacylglycerol beta-glucosyltransferase
MPRRSSARKRILIFSASYGGSARGAGEALAAYYREHCADTVEVALVDFLETFMPSLNVLAKFAYQQAAEFFPAGRGDFRHLEAAAHANQVIQELSAGGMERIATVLAEQRPDIVISTSPVAGGVAAEVSTTTPFLAVSVLTDLDARDVWIHPASAFVFVASREVRDELAVGGTPWDRIVVSGVPVAEKFALVGPAAQSRRELGIADRFTVLLLAGPSSQTSVDDIADQLASSGIQVMAVAGTNARLQRRLEASAKKTDLIRVYGFTEEMPKLMRAADVLIGKAGGLAVPESLARALPLIVHGAVPGRESRNADFLVNYGSALLSRDESDAVEKVRFLSTHPERLAQMSSNAGTLGKSEAVQAICERVLAAAR